LPFLVYAFGAALWQFLLVALFEGACMTAGTVVWGTLMSTRVPPELRGRVHSLDWFVSIGLTPVSFALTGPMSSAIGIDATLVLAAIVPALAMLALYVVAGLRRDEERYADAASGASASAAAGGSTPAIS
jgi:MFS family permease